VQALRTAANNSAAHETARISAVRAATARRIERARRAHQAAVTAKAAAARRAATAHHAAAAHRGAARSVHHRRTRVVRHAKQVSRQSRHFRLATRPARGMSAVIAYARSQVGKRYVRGAEGPFSFDCSGFTKRAYARAGLRLQHSSSSQAARARPVSRSAARPGDLVVGLGHVGIYMGNGMMIDAGNSRVGVTFRRMYGGLHIERF
jgi:cell wall-associated NlpC family hydrolase